MEELHVIVSGPVQGVGFRATAKMIADKLKLTGFARNLPEGTVEVFAQGQRSSLDELLAQLKQEFPATYTIRYFAPSREYVGFRIF